ncbi:MAG TPA: OstA-like protein [Bacteroidia bacterium]|nr:OstA-like protein [Bacteroidia bacterium]HRS59388.1 OstA-like protein [Bacteroidia bacterium]HRU68723.1 OstA-like protein [Bacteroidia bacterium]
MFKAKHILIVLLSFPFFNVYPQVKQLRIIHANTLEGSESGAYKVRKLIGNVALEHEGMLLFCDSAYHYESENFFDAYGRVRIRQGDSLFIKAGYLRYDLSTKNAVIEKGVRLSDNNMVLTTSRIIYNMSTKSGYYNQYAEIVDDSSKLTSNAGRYDAAKKIMVFKNNVVLLNPDFTLNTDSLLYKINLHTAFFIAPTVIVSEESKIYCEDGWYNTKTKQAEFRKNATITSGSRIISGDRIHYNSKSNEIQVSGKVMFNDTAEKTIISGNYSIRNENTKTTLITDSALFIHYFENDTLFLHSDTIQLSTIRKNDKDYNLAVMWKHVKGYSTSYQLKCDSLIYNSEDSTISFYGSPVVWQDKSQISAQEIKFFLKNGEVDKMQLTSNSFMIESIDSLRFNQVKGKNMTGIFDNNQLSEVFTQGNAESVYFLRDDQEKFIGRNNIASSFIHIVLNNKKIEKINFMTSPEGYVEPPKSMDNQDALLNGFKWLEKERPLEIKDIFRQ